MYDILISNLVLITGEDVEDCSSNVYTIDTGPAWPGFDLHPVKVVPMVYSEAKICEKTTQWLRMLWNQNNIWEDKAMVYTEHKNMRRHGNILHWNQNTCEKTW